MNITLRKVTASDSDNLLAWRNEDSTIPWMGQTRRLTTDEHNQWFTKALHDDNLLFLIIEVDGVAAGQIRYQRSNEVAASKAAKVSINIAGQYHGKGVATLAFAKGSVLVRSANFAQSVYANVLPNNFGSIRAMEKAGFKKIKMVVVNEREHLLMTDQE
jgi:UDP-2,4-diacetamido-2,4,6-trideoxy-beta-L-altropyranose hydrolase